MELGAWQGLPARDNTPWVFFYSENLQWYSTSVLNNPFSLFSLVVFCSFSFILFLFVFRRTGGGGRKRGRKNIVWFDLNCTALSLCFFYARWEWYMQVWENSTFHQPEKYCLGPNPNFHQFHWRLTNIFWIARVATCDTQSSKKIDVIRQLKPQQSQVFLGCW